MARGLLLTLVSMGVASSSCAAQHGIAECRSLANVGTCLASVPSEGVDDDVGSFALDSGKT